MDINERVKAIRKAKEMTTVEFGKAIGLSNSGITEIEKGRRPVTERSIMLICASLNVSENWLRTGEGSMFIETDEAIISTLAKKYNLDDMDCSIIESYMKLPPSARSVMKAYLRTLVSECAKHDADEANAILRSHADAAFADEENPPKNSEAHA